MDPRKEAEKTLLRLEGRLTARLAREGHDLDGSLADPWAVFQRRLHRRWPELFALLFELYGTRYDLYFFLERILFTMARAALDREPELRARDLVHEHDPAWHLSQRNRASPPCSPTMSTCSARTWDACGTTSPISGTSGSPTCT